jgi:two-component system phosphate regulon response regulator PhoB
MENNRRVLVIDDDHFVLRMTELIFLRAGYEVHLAENGMEGLAKVNEVKPDLLILDIMMPGMSGLEVCQRLRADPITMRLPVIMLSACAMEDKRSSMLQAGADDYLRKPADPKELIARAEALLRRAA